jgi:glycosyltransferase involved in cell wall biosynthesis
VIPKRIYTTWVSDKPMPEKFAPLLATWGRFMPEYEVVILGMENIPHNPWVDAALAKKQFILAGHYARCQRIYETGGIYLDIDVEVVRSFDDLLSDGMFLGVETDKVVNNAVFGARAGHPFMAQCMAYMAAFPLDAKEVENETGPRMFTNLMYARNWQPQNKTHYLGDIRVYNSKFFYPYLYTEKYNPKCLTAETHAIHHWAYTWNPVLKEPVSIIIPCYNQAEYLGEAIDSALAQTVAAHEIIVVDDGSTLGDVAAVVKPYGGKVKLIRQENRGVSAARNAGIAAATGTWIATLDADDKLAPEYIERLIGKDDIVSPALLTFGAGRPQRWVSDLRNPVCADYVKSNRSMCCSLFRRKWWEKIGGLDESMRSGFEDWDFWVRMTHAGATVTIVDEVLFYYRRYEHDRSQVPCAVDMARAKSAEIMPYMRDKWTRLGIGVRPGSVRSVRSLKYPVALAVECNLGGKRYPKGTRIDRELAVALKAAGQLTDPRIA